MLRRTLFGAFWFAIFWMGIAAIGGGIADSASPAHAASAPTNAQAGQPKTPGSGEAAAAFHQRHGLAVILGAAALAFAGTLAGILPGTKRLPRSRVS